MNHSLGRVIVVDDHDDSRQMLLDALAFSDRHAVGAADVATALALCAAERFECMVLDEVLGDEASGLELAQRLHREPLRPERIVMVSGLASHFFTEALREGVIDAFLEKPVSLAELMDRVGPAP